MPREQAPHRPQPLTKRLATDVRTVVHGSPGTADHTLAAVRLTAVGGAGVAGVVGAQQLAEGVLHAHPALATAIATGGYEQIGVWSAIVGGYVFTSGGIAVGLDRRGRSQMRYAPAHHDFIHRRLQRVAVGSATTAALGGGVIAGTAGADALLHISATTAVLHPAGLVAAGATAIAVTAGIGARASRPLRRSGVAS